jgi:hypothetical protein
MYPDQYPSLIMVRVLNQLEMLQIFRPGVCDFSLAALMPQFDTGCGHAEIRAAGEEPNG